MKNVLLKVILCFLIWINIQGYWQTSFAFIPPDKKVEALLHQGNTYFNNGFYYQAIQFYKEVLSLVPHHTQAHYQLAECYRNLFEYQKAKHHYEKVYVRSKQAYPLSGYYLALMYKLSGDYSKSVEYFDLFTAFAAKEEFQDKDYYLQQAALEKEGSVIALKNALKPKGEFHFVRLPTPVNTAYNDYAATIYETDSCIAFTSTRNDTKGSNLDDQYGDFFSDHFLFSKNEAGTWENISKQHNFTGINTNFSEGTGVFNHDQSVFYFTGCYQEGFCHIYKTILKNGKWQSPTPLNKPINLDGYDSKQPTLSSGEDTLFFVSNRPGGFGMQDIWMSVLSEDGKWQSPVNLGAGINTPQHELSPFYYPLENALFFSSNGHKGYGGFDVFVATAATKNPVVTNLGPPFNSSKDDLYLTLGQQKGYLSSNRDNVDGNFDIYTFHMTTHEAVLLSLQNDNSDIKLQDYFDVLQFFSKQDLQYYEQLPLEEKTRVKHFIQEQSFQKVLLEKATLSEHLAFFYEALPSEEKEVIERLAEARKNFFLNENQDVALAEDHYYYQSLPAAEKEKVRQIIEAKTFQKILDDGAMTNPQLMLFYESLPAEDKERIDKAIALRKNFIEKAYQENATSTLEDLFFYHSLPLAQKEKIDRVIAAKTFQKEKGAEHVEMRDDFMVMYEQLPLEEKESVDRLAQTQRFTAKMMEDRVLLKGNAGQDYFDIGAMAIGNPENITIEGKLTHKGKPASAVSVSLVSGSPQAEKTVITNQHGEFAFHNVDYHQHQKILFDQDKTGFMELTQFALEELKIIVLQDTIIEESFDNIYFETNQYIINDSSKVILDSLASFHFRYPDVKIEISAYADTTGNTKYNKALSFKRASEALNYLVNKGVDPAALHILPKGKEIPQKGKDLQYSRRIEFAIQGVSASYNPTRAVYVISPRPDLQEISHKYDLSLIKLKALNQHIKGDPAPFTPIRISVK